MQVKVRKGSILDKPELFSDASSVLVSDDRGIPNAIIISFNDSVMVKTINDSDFSGILKMAGEFGAIEKLMESKLMPG
jgi:hypothetical protein